MEKMKKTLNVLSSLVLAAMTLVAHSSSPNGYPEPESPGSSQASANNVFVEVLNSNTEFISAFSVEIYTADWSQSMGNDSFVLNSGATGTASFELSPGNYWVTVYAEMDNVICDYPITVVRGGTAYFEYFGTRYNGWFGTPSYVPY